MQAHDAIPEDLAEDALEMTEEVNDALCEVTEDEEANPLEITKDEDKPDDLDKKVADGVVRALRELGFYKDPAMKVLDELEVEEKETEDEDPDDITEDAYNEESVTVDPEKMKDSATLLRTMKPVIAAIKNPKERKKAADALARMIKGSRVTSSDYGTLMNIKQKKATKDSKAKVMDSDYDFGMSIAKRYNPHYKEEK
jgi:hypothetical protein